MSENTEKPNNEKEEKKPFSYHIFLFPFRFRWNEKDENNLLSFHKKFEDKKKEKDEFNNTNWNYENYELKDISSAEDYNEFMYFYDFARDAIYDRKTDNNKKVIEDTKKILRHYSVKDEKVKDAKYTIKLRCGNTYELDVVKIFLHVYETGVALLSFHLENRQVKEWSDIRNINEYGRRIYPQFLTDGEDKISIPKDKFLADSIELTGFKKETFERYNKSYDEALPSFISELLNIDFAKPKSLIDDRMFVISWYVNDCEVNKLKEKIPQQSKISISGVGQGRITTNSKYRYYTNDSWYRYIFIDTNSTMCQHDGMREELTRKHTYQRFVDWGTFFGVTRYSFVMLTNEGGRFTTKHVETMYYQMVVLSLMQRASILKFSDDVSNISAELNDSVKDTKNLTEIRKLNASYLKFSNKMYFREVTAQEQGIELYDMIQSHMRIERDVKDLNREIDELYQYANLIEDKKNNEQLKLITVLGAVFIIPTFITGFFGMNILQFVHEIQISSEKVSIFHLTHASYIWVSILLFLPFVSILFLKKEIFSFWKGKKTKWIIIIIVGYILAIILTLITVFYSFPVHITGS